MTWYTLLDALLYLSLGFVGTFVVLLVVQR